MVRVGVRGYTALKPFGHWWTFTETLTDVASKSGMGSETITRSATTGSGSVGLHESRQLSPSTPATTRSQGSR